MEWANDLQTDQLPALLHAIAEDEHAVRICAQKAKRGNADNPPALLMWLIREKKHTGSIAPATSPLPYGAPPLPAPEEHADNLARMRDWRRIQAAMDRRQDIKDLYADLHDSKADPSVVRETMIAVLDEMNRQRQEAQQ